MGRTPPGVIIQLDFTTPGRPSMFNDVQQDTGGAPDRLLSFPSSSENARSSGFVVQIFRELGISVKVE
jgi:hypothetical protein